MLQDRRLSFENTSSILVSLYTLNINNLIKLVFVQKVPGPEYFTCWYLDSRGSRVEFISEWNKHIVSKDLEAPDLGKITSFCSFFHF